MISSTLLTKPPRWLVGLSLVTVAIVTIPLVYVVWRVGEIPWVDIAVVLSRPRVAEITLNTVGLSAAVSATALMGGVGVAGLLTRVRFRAAKALLLISALPLAVPSYLASYGWLVISPGINGFLPSWLLLSAVTVPMSPFRWQQR